MLLSVYLRMVAEGGWHLLISVNVVRYYVRIGEGWRYLFIRVLSVFNRADLLPNTWYYLPSGAFSATHEVSK